MKNWRVLLIFILVIFCYAAIPEANGKGGEPMDQLQKIIEIKSYQRVIDYSDSLLRANPNIKNKPSIYLCRADAYYYLNQLELSLQEYLYTQQLTEYSEIINLSMNLEVNSHIGFCYRELGLFQQALPYYNSALDLANSLRDSVEMAIQNYNLGTIYLELGDWKSSIASLNKSYQIDLARKDTAALAYDLSYITDLHLRAGEFNDALLTSKESIKLYREKGSNANTFGMRLGKVGYVFFKKGTLDSAEYYFTAAKIHFEKVGDSIKLSGIWNDLANLAIAKKDIRQAIVWAAKSKNYNASRGDNSNVPLSNLILINAYIKSGNYSMAQKTIIENEQMTRQLGLLEALKDTYHLKSQLYEKTGNYIESKKALSDYVMIKDSLFSIEKLERYKNLEMTIKFDKIQYENEKLILSNQIAHADLEKQLLQKKWLIICLIIVFLSASILIYVLYTRFKLKQKVLMLEINELRRQIKILMDGQVDDINLDLTTFNEKLTSTLSEREFEILKYTLGDYTNGEIADKVFVSVNTVKFHLRNIYTKLGVSNRKEIRQYIVQGN